MPEIFAGDWTVEGAISGDIQLDHQYRFVIAGSVASDGAHPVSLTNPPISVSGATWSISLEYFTLYAHPIADPNPPRPPEWVPFDARRTSVAYTIENGLVVFLGTSAKDQFLICRNVDPKLNPWHPFTNPYDFTLPKRR
jgi:hypothetical protein